MRYEKRIQKKEELKEWVSQQDKVILFGDKSLVIILLRYYISISEKDKIRGLSYIETKSEKMAFDEYVLKRIEEYQARPDSQVMILEREEARCQKLRERLEGWDDSQICYVDYHLIAELSNKDNVDLDFMCVGFTKCGTTSLYDALRENKQIFLPRGKESLYGKWKDQYLDAPERFQEMYFSRASKKKKWGCVEPTYFKRANFVYETFGNSPKVIFMLRNPADATYSYFKMMMRRSDNPTHRMYFRKYKKYTPEMFQDYLKDDIFSKKDERFHYDIWLKEYLKYFDKDSVMFVFFEEIIKEPERILNEIQEFIGVEPQKMELPHSNVKKQVSKNYFSARVNAKLHKWSVYYKKNGSRSAKRRFLKVRDFILKYTLIDNDEKISADDKEMLMEYYKDSIQEVEKITGKNLEGIWYNMI